MIGTAPTTDFTTQPFLNPNPALAPTAPGAGKPAPVVNNVSLKSGAVPAPTTNVNTQPTPVTTQPTPAPNTTNPYGSAGNLTTTGADFNPSTLPPWLAQQFFQNTQPNTSESGGGPTTSWAYNQNLKDQNGNAVVQTGQGPDGIHDGMVKDKSLVTYDPTLGWVTPPSNIIYTPDGGAWNLVGPASIPLILGAGLGLDALYGLNGFGDAAAITSADETGGGLLTNNITNAANGVSNIPGAADALTPGINQAIDTSLMPPVTPTTIPDLPPPPNITTPSIPGLDTPFDVNLQPPPNVTVPPPTIPDTSGGTGILDKITNSITNDPLRAVGVGLTGASLLGNHPSQVPSNLTNSVNANGPLADQARGTLTNNGQPTADQMSVITATINQQRQQGTEAIIQASINAGQGGKDSLVTQDKIRAFNEQLATMQIQLVQKQAEQNVLNAMQELGMVTQEQFQLAQLQLQQDNAAQQRAMSIMQSLGWLFSGGGKGTTPAATPPVG